MRNFFVCGLHCAERKGFGNFGRESGAVRERNQKNRNGARNQWITNNTIQTITEEETIYLNTLTMNEAYCYVGVKTPKAFIPSIRMYNYLMSNGEKNIHHNYNGFVELLSKI